MARTKGVRHHGPSIRAWRQHRDLTVEQLAALVGYDRSSLNNLELEIRDSMPVARLMRIASALSVDPAVLLRDPIGQEPDTRGEVA